VNEEIAPMTQMKRMAALLLVTVTVACQENPAAVRSTATSFPLVANWNATASPVGTSTVRGTLAVKQYTGYHHDVTLTINGAPNATYQWRIFRGDCATTAVAANNTAPTGLLLFETIQSYPDVTAAASGAGTVTRSIAGSLDSLKPYSIRIRASQTATNWNGTSPIACGNLQRSPA
jgi:hypothetical protein